MRGGHNRKSLPGEGWCHRCLQSKPAADFWKDKSRRVGLASMCKACTVERRNVMDRDDPTNKRERTRASQARHPERSAAGRLVQDAVRAGTVAKWPVCAVPECAETKVDGHHADYSKPLDVVWLCRRHHSQVHVESRQA